MMLRVYTTKAFKYIPSLDDMFGLIISINHYACFTVAYPTIQQNLPAAVVRVSGVLRMIYNILYKISNFLR